MKTTTGLVSKTSGLLALAVPALIAKQNPLTTGLFIKATDSLITNKIIEELECRSKNGSYIDPKDNPAF
ncbi:hypothetical protein AB4151_17730 [Vibrio splendidus]|uniref:Uncharacterized protein n=1 Tax=Vibrio splendidus TaxID=29497 RepID=A0A2N7CCY1_VIBSP|nr:hypothetical protein [Vibrio splendidus]PMF20221.1 hypothetical protein BCV19_11275 [Vibrio splendidus]